MVLFINIIGGLPANVKEFTSSFANSSAVNNFKTLFVDYSIYIVIVGIIILVQESYKKVKRMGDKGNNKRAWQTL